MFFAFFCLLMLCGGVGVLVWLAWQRMADHLRDNPEAAKLLAEHVIAPIMAGKNKDQTESPDSPTEGERDALGSAGVPAPGRLLAGSAEGNRNEAPDSGASPAGRC
jgi:hypothetical protein